MVMGEALVYILPHHKVKFDLQILLEYDKELLEKAKSTSKSEIGRRITQRGTRLNAYRGFGNQPMCVRPKLSHVSCRSLLENIITSTYLGSCSPHLSWNLFFGFNLVYKVSAQHHFQSSVTTYHVAPFMRTTLPFPNRKMDRPGNYFLQESTPQRARISKVEFVA